MDPHTVEVLIYPPEQVRRKNIPLPDFQYYYDRIHAKGSKVNIAYCWIEYKTEHPDGYEQSQFYEYYNKFVESHYSKRDAKMAVERVPEEKMYIDLVGDQPFLLLEPDTGEVHKVHFFATTLGVSRLIYAEAFLNEKLSSFVEGTIHAVQFYGDFDIMENFVNVTIPFNYEKKNSDGTGTDNKVSINEAEQRVIDYISQNSSITIKELVAVSGYSDGYIRKILASLKEKRLLSVRVEIKLENGLLYVNEKEGHCI